MTVRDQCTKALQHANVQAFLRVIREGETSQTDDAYYTLVGGGRFETLDDHPRRLVYIQPALKSSAAGAYQFLTRTWDECRAALALPDFSQVSQDLAAVYLTLRRGALEDVIAGRLDTAIAKCAKEWASLPGDAYGQGGISAGRAREVYLRYGGTLENATKATSALSTTQGKPMAPILPALIGPLVSELAQHIPRVAALWKGKSEVAERNVALGTAILETVGNAVGAANAEEAVSVVASSPEAARLAREAVDAQWAKLDDMREASIDKARMMYHSAERIVFGNMVFHEILALLIVLLCASGMAGAFVYANLSQSTKDNIVMLALVGGFIGIKEFFFGGSRGSDVKTAMLDKRQQ